MLEELLDRGPSLDDDAALTAWLRDCADAVERDPGLAMLIFVLSDLPSAVAASYADKVEALALATYASPSWTGSNGPRVARAVAEALRPFAEPEIDS